MISPLPNANAKPMAQYSSAAIEKLVRIFAMTVPTFLPREKPISSSAKPACIQITSSAATRTQIELMATLSGSTPFENASEVSAEATAGSASASAPAPAAAPLSRLNVMRRPPRFGFTSESLGRAGAGVFGPVSKDHGRVFAYGRGVFQTAKRNVRMFVHVDSPRVRR